MDAEITTVLTREVVEQFEYVRKSGMANMFDRKMVGYIAGPPLEDLDRAWYGKLLSNYSELLEHYGIGKDGNTE